MIKDNRKNSGNFLTNRLVEASYLLRWSIPIAMIGTCASCATTARRTNDSIAEAVPSERNLLADGGVYYKMSPHETFQFARQLSRLPAGADRNLIVASLGIPPQEGGDYDVSLASLLYLARPKCTGWMIRYWYECDQPEINGFSQTGQIEFFFNSCFVLKSVVGGRVDLDQFQRISPGEINSRPE